MTVQYSIDALSMQFELIGTKGLDWPKWKFNQSYRLLNEVNTENIQTTLVELTVSKNCEQIELINFGKSNNDTIVKNGQIIRDQSLTINKIWVNGILLENASIVKHAVFKPEYNKSVIDYAQINNLILESSSHQLDFYYNGCWTFEFVQPFFIWYNELLFNEINKYNYQYKRSHLGIADKEHLTTLDTILQQLS